MRRRSRRPELLLLVVADVLAAALLAGVVLVSLSASDPPLREPRPTVARTSDERDRLLEQYEAVRASKDAHPRRGVPAVFIVTDDAPLDALVARPAAAVLGGPVLPVAHSRVANIVRRELSRLDPERIVVVGGPSAVSDAVAEALRSYTPGEVTRLAGPNRYATAALVATTAFDAPVRHVVVTTGSREAAVLAPAAGDTPVLLVAPERVPPETLAALRELRPGIVTVLGGPEDVSDAVVSQVRQALPAAEVGRLSGSAPAGA